MKNSTPAWLSAEVQAQTEPPPIPIIKKEIYNVSECDLININICWNLSYADSKTYKPNIAMFDHGQP